MMTNLKGIIDGIRKIMRQDTGLNGDAQRIEQLGWMLFLKIFSDKDKELEVTNETYVSPIPDEFHWESWAGDDEGITGDELQVFVDQKLFPSLRNLNVGLSDDLPAKRALIVREVFEGNNNYMKSGTNIRKVLNKLNEIDFNVAKDRHAFGELYETILKELQSAGKSGEFYTPRALTEFICEIIDPRLNEKIFDPSCGTGGYLTAAIEHLKKQANNIEERESIAKNVIGWEYKPLPYLLATTNLILHDIEVPNVTFRDSLDQPLNSYTEKNRVDAILANPPFGGVVSNNNENNFPQNYRTKESADLFLVLMVHLLKKNGRAGIVLPDYSLSGGGVKSRIIKKLLTECDLHTIIRLPNSVFEPYATAATNLLFFTKGTETKQIWYYEHKLPLGQKSYSKTRPIQLKEFEPIKHWWNNREESNVSWKVDIQDIINNDYNLDIKNPHSEVSEEVDLNKIQHSINIKLNSLSTTLSHLKQIINRDGFIITSDDFQTLRLSDFLKRSKIKTVLEDSKNYKRVTIKTKHGGVFLRDTEVGKKIGTKNQFLIKEGQFVVSKIDARHGAFGIAPKEVDGAIITGNFWAYDFDQSKIDIDWFNQFTSSEGFYRMCEMSSTGTTHRRYLNEQTFMDFEIQIPSLQNQRKIIREYFEALGSLEGISSLSNDIGNAISSVFMEKSKGI